MKTVLITGSEGLIGSSLTEYLGQQSILVKHFDIRFHSNHPDTGNVLDKLAIKKAVQGCVGVIHLAGTSRVILGEQNPDLCWKNNVEGTNNIIEAALESPYKPWIIYASSREVYGQQDSFPVTEAAPLKPMNIYAHSKVEAEKRIIDVRDKGLSTVILRFSNVFGSPYDYPDRVISAFCRAALLNEPLFVEGARNVFDFTFVEDVVRGIGEVISVLLAKPQNLPTIHFTTGRGITLKEAADIIIAKAKSSSRIKETSPRSFDVSRFYGNSGRAKSLLGWSPQFSFEEAIDQFLFQLKTTLNEEKRAFSQRVAL